MLSRLPSIVSAMNNKPLPALAAVSYLGGPDPEPPWQPGRQLTSMQQRLSSRYDVTLRWSPSLLPDLQRPRLAALAAHSALLADYSASQCRQQRGFVVIGGDHSNAIGLWGGVLKTLEPGLRFGLLWVDAHMDAHTFATTPSGNIHGMPLAALLGNFDPELATLYSGPPYLNPQRLCLLGVDSFESGEAQLLQRLQVPVLFRDALQREGLDAVLAAALSALDASCDRYGISIDLDALDCTDAPAVSTPVAGGPRAEELCRALAARVNRDKLVGLEIAEYYPSLDKGERSQAVIADLIGAVFSTAR